MMSVRVSMESCMHVRWMIRRDLVEVLGIEKLSFPEAWPKSVFVEHLRRRNTIGMVCELDDRVVGFMIYNSHKGYLDIINFAVDPEFRRRGVGTAMVNKLKGKLSPHRRTRLRLEVSDSNLPAHLFFKACGFRWIKTLRGQWSGGDGDGSDGDVYVMEFSCGEQP